MGRKGFDGLAVLGWVLHTLDTVWKPKRVYLEPLRRREERDVVEVRSRCPKGTTIQVVPGDVTGSITMGPNPMALAKPSVAAGLEWSLSEDQGTGVCLWSDTEGLSWHVCPYLY